MNCVRSLCEADTHRESLLEKELHAALAPEVRTRQVAVLYLQAAAMIDNALTRKLLQRRAAELILPRLGDRGQRLAC